MLIISYCYEAQNNLGHMYYFGNGVLQDNVRAHMWYNIASTNGHPKASKWRGETAAKMTSADTPLRLKKWLGNA